jgi:hypothetical protein
MYVTPHDWTPFGQQAQPRGLIEPNQRKWDYRHEVLAEKHLQHWQLFAHVKWLDLWFHLRPSRLLGILRTRDRFRRRQLLCVLCRIGMVWLSEVNEFLRDRVLTGAQNKRAKSGADRHRSATFSGPKEKPKLTANGYSRRPASDLTRRLWPFAAQKNISKISQAIGPRPTPMTTVNGLRSVGLVCWPTRERFSSGLGIHDNSCRASDKMEQ